MPKESTYKTSQKKNIDDLLKDRKSDALIIYITGDKRPLETFGTQIHPEVIPLFYEHLKLIGKKKKISLLLYSSGGALEAPWALVNLIREYCDEFEVLIPFKALSAGTLICLGADKIVTTPLSLLSPVDPTGNFVVNNQQRSIQVEDVSGFIDFAKTKIGLKNQQVLSEILKSLVSDTPPQVLGNINRTHALIRQLVDKLLDTHNKKVDKEQKDSIGKTLTEKLYSHQHLINRKELAKLGFNDLVEELNSINEERLSNIFGYFSEKMKLNEVFDPANELGSRPKCDFILPRAVIASNSLCHSFKSMYSIERQENVPGKPSIFLNIKDLGWQKSDI